jgi:glycine/D-amino acid oxidase-like deaminating enzyme
MSTEAVVVIVIVLALLVVAALLVPPMLRRRRLQQRFGPEYDRTVETSESRREAEQQLAERERRVAGMDIKPLAAEQRERYAAEWLQVQERFVDDPSGAVAEAQRLVTVVMDERGYPTEGYEQRIADLSVEHGGVLNHYRAAHDLSERAAGGTASTEDLRQAMVHYRELFADLLEERGSVRHK